MSDFEILQLQSISALKSSFSSNADTGTVMLPALSHLLDGLPFYQAPEFTATFRSALAQVLALNMPNPGMVYYSTANEFATYSKGYRDQFYPGVTANVTSNVLLSGVVAAAPSLNSDWWANYAVSFLTDAVQDALNLTSQFNAAGLASDMASFNVQLAAGLFPCVTAVLQNSYGQTSYPFGLLGVHEDAALQQLTTAISGGPFAANISQGITSGGDAATAATWLLYELWILLAALGAPNVDTLIGQFSKQGLTVPAQVGPTSWRTYAAWYPPLSGSDILPVATPSLTANMPDEDNLGYAIPHGFSGSVVYWGPSNISKYYVPYSG